MNTFVQGVVDVDDTGVGPETGVVVVGGCLGRSGHGHVQLGQTT